LAVLAALHDADNEASLLVNVSEQIATHCDCAPKGSFLLYRTLDMRANTLPETAVVTEADPAFAYC